MIRPTGAAIPVLAVALAGCAAVQQARERLIAGAPRCQDETASVYFRPGDANLTPEGRKVIADAAARARRCEVVNVTVVGLTDASGDEATNLDLSKRRAQAVTAALADADLPTAEFDMAAYGEGGATTADGAAAPMRRRADVILHLKPRR